MGRHAVRLMARYNSDSAIISRVHCHRHRRRFLSGKFMSSVMPAGLLQCFLTARSCFFRQQTANEACHATTAATTAAACHAVACGCIFAHGRCNAIIKGGSCAAFTTGQGYCDYFTATSRPSLQDVCGEKSKMQQQDLSLSVAGTANDCTGLALP